jgi:nucleoside 2-deoxyribosyltransferase
MHDNVAIVNKVLALGDQQILLRDPLRGKGNLASTTADGGLTTTVSTAADIMRRDYRDVISCDIILAHLDAFGSTRPLTGTIMELGWAWERHTPVLAVAAESNYLMRSHPMVSQTVSHYFTNLGDAWQFILRYQLK